MTSNPHGRPTPLICDSARVPIVSLIELSKSILAVDYIICAPSIICWWRLILWYIKIINTSNVYYEIKSYSNHIIWCVSVGQYLWEICVILFIYVYTNSKSYQNPIVNSITIACLFSNQIAHTSLFIGCILPNLSTVSQIVRPQEVYYYMNIYRVLNI